MAIWSSSLTQDGNDIIIWALLDLTEELNAKRELKDLNVSLESRVRERSAALERANAELSAALATLQHTQEELLASEKMASLGSLVAGIAHELNTPIGNSLLASTALRDRVGVRIGQATPGPLARSLGARVGDAITLIAPAGQVTPAGVVPRLKQMTVAGTFDSGHYEYDSALVMLHHEDAQRIFRLEGPTGVRLKLKDLHQAREVAQQLAQSLSGMLLIRDWTQQNKTWFAAVQLEKRMMFIILTLIVAVAAFNLVSTLVMTVTDKRADIAILRTLGASPKSIMGIFVVQGAMVGVIGTCVGLLLGLGIAANIDVIVPAIERALNASFLPKDIYLISKMPSEPQASDIVPIGVISLVLAFVATLYPSWRASRVNPAEALRYE